MGDFGQIIDPYRVAPATGNLQDYNQFAARAEQIDAMRTAAMLAAATRQYLAQQNGLPQGVDPMAVQQYSGNEQQQRLAASADRRAWDTNALAHNRDTRAQKDFESKYQFANGFINNLPQQTDPLAHAAQMGGGPAGAELLAKLLGDKQVHQNDYDTRVNINNADNAAMLTRTQMTLDAQRKAKEWELNQQQQYETGQRQSGILALQQFLNTGDPSHLAGVDPRYLNPNVMDALDQGRSRKEAEARQAKMEAERGKYAPGAQKDGTSIVNNPDFAKQIVATQFPNTDPAEVIKQVILGTEQLGGDPRYRAVRSAFPAEYNDAWNARQQELRNEQQRQILEMIAGVRPTPSPFRMGQPQ